MNRAAALLLGLALSLPWGAAHAETGLLVGLRADRPQGALYRTLYITADAQAVRQAGEDRSSILMSTPSGLFSRAAVNRLEPDAAAGHHEILTVGWAGTVKAPALGGGDGNGLGTCGPVNDGFTLLFVSPQLLSVEQRSWSEDPHTCADEPFPIPAFLWHLPLGPPEPGTLVSLFSDEPPSSAFDSQPVNTLNKLFSSTASDKLMSAWDSTFAALPARTRSDLIERGMDVAQPYNWAMVRRSGRWALRARVDTHTFDVPVILPRWLTGWDGLAVPWITIRARVPGARDAFSSPNGTLLGVMTADTLNVYRLNAGRFGAPALTVPLEAPESVVSLQWSSGQNVRSWAREVARFSRP
ncbi:hypothetical protein ACFFLM_18045 [Deinococcus oregonensis]|uniref:Uncharacterized protein n=1 Tax=Deinococcus oregonensis TaxID=1805970 RepID=A0ABV6B637_9DEIO